MEKEQFRYFYGSDTDEYTFYRIPKLLITDERFKFISNDAKILYGLMLDRMSLSQKNGWIDEENRVYIYFSVTDIMEMLNVGKNKAISALAELDSESGIGLIEKKKQGFGKPAVIYVKNFLEESQDCDEPKSVDNCHPDNTEVYISNHDKFKNQTSRSLKNKPQEVCFSNPNKNNINNTDINNISNPIVSMREDAIRYGEIIQRNIELSILKERHKTQVEIIDGLFDIMLETLLSDQDFLVVSGNRYPAEFVKSRILRIRMRHIEYVIGSMRKYKGRIRNIKNYLFTALFNAPTTMDSYFQAELNSKSF